MLSVGFKALLPVAPASGPLLGCHSMKLLCSLGDLAVLTLLPSLLANDASGLRLLVSSSLVLPSESDVAPEHVRCHEHVLGTLRHLSANHSDAVLGQCVRCTLPSPVLAPLHYGRCSLASHLSSDRVSACPLGITQDILSLSTAAPDTPLLTRGVH